MLRDQRPRGGVCQSWHPLEGCCPRPLGPGPSTGLPLSWMGNGRALCHFCPAVGFPYRLAGARWLVPPRPGGGIISSSARLAHGMGSQCRSLLSAGGVAQQGAGGRWWGQSAGRAGRRAPPCAGSASGCCRGGGGVPGGFCCSGQEVPTSAPDAVGAGTPRCRPGEAAAVDAWATPSPGRHEPRKRWTRVCFRVGRRRGGR